MKQYQTKSHYSVCKSSFLRQYTLLKADSNSKRKWKVLNWVVALICYSNEYRKYLLKWVTVPLTQMSIANIYSNEYWKYLLKWVRTPLTHMSIANIYSNEYWKYLLKWVKTPLTQLSIEKLYSNEYRFFLLKWVKAPLTQMSSYPNSGTTQLSARNSCEVSFSGASLPLFEAL